MSREVIQKTGSRFIGDSAKGVSTREIRDSMRRPIGLMYEGEHYWVVKGSGSTTPWHVVIEHKGEFYCTCLGFITHGKCRHVNEVLRFYKSREQLSKRGDKVQVEVPTGFKFIDEMVGGKISNDVVYAIYGESQVGKTITTLNLVYSLSEKLKEKGVNSNILLIDTEGGLHRFVDAWDAKLRARFDAGDVHLVVKRTIFSLMKFHGVDIELKTSDKGKMTLMLKGISTPSIIEELIEKHKIGIVVYDSLTAPLRIFPSAQENFPVRSDVTGLLLARILDLIEKYGVFVFITHHVSMNPANPYAQPGVRGGSIVKYLSKAIFYIERAGKGSAGRGKRANYRKIWLVRWFDKADWSEMRWFKITDVGVEDVTPKEIEAITRRK